MVSGFFVILVVALLGAGLLVLVARNANGPVTLARARRFARRQELLVTTVNGPLVVRALAVTHRWRALGLTTGVLLGILWALQDSRLTINFAAAFLGWFVGAVIAEWRLAGLPVDGGRRTASLTRRTIGGYLRPDSLALLAATCVALLALFVTVVVRADDGGVVTQAVAWIVVAALGLGALRLTLSRVVSRPQPGSAPELVEADDALRARSANVLAGSAIVAAGYPASSLLGLVSATTGPDAAEAWQAAGLVSLFLTVLVGWLVAVRRSPVRTRPGAPVAATPGVGSPGVAP